MNEIIKQGVRVNVKTRKHREQCSSLEYKIQRMMCVFER